MIEPFDQKLYYSLQIIIPVLAADTQHLGAGSTQCYIAVNSVIYPQQSMMVELLFPSFRVEKLCLTGIESRKIIYFIVSPEYNFNFMLFSYHNRRFFLSLEQTLSHIPSLLLQLGLWDFFNTAEKLKSSLLVSEKVQEVLFS